MTYIHNICTAVPTTFYTQEEILAKMLATIPLSIAEQRKLSMVYKNSGIAKRHTAIPQFFDYFQAATTPTISQRMTWFWQYAPDLCQEAVEKCLPPTFDKQQITHLITVSCTGLAAPGLDIVLLNQLQLQTTIYRTSVNFMGCYAAFHALKQADLICKTNPAAKVLVVCVELCSLHFQLLPDDDNTRANLLFADGAAAVLLSAQSQEKNIEPSGSQPLRIHSFYADLITQGNEDMAWYITENAFQMKLSAYIPQLVEENIALLLTRALQTANLDITDIDQWAIHPGGKKILDNVCQALQLPAEKLAVSYETLRNYGNMSSVTSLFVLQKMMQNQVIQATNTQNQEKKYTLAVGFGPGLTMESMLLQ
jgi:prepilin-type processing-associated H-X9-DG protein